MRYQVVLSVNRVNVRFDEQGVYLYEEDHRVAEAIIVNQQDNAHVKRARSPFSMKPKEESTDV